MALTVRDSSLLRRLAAQQQPVAAQPQRAPMRQAPRMDPSVRRALMNDFSGGSKAKDEEEDEGGGWGRGLGVIINNPITRAIGTPLDWLARPMRASILSIEESAKQLPDWAEGASALLGPIPAAARMLVDEDRVAEDTRSIREKFDDPEYGFGSIAKSTGNQWADRFVGLGGDIALDPLTYVAGMGFIGKTAPAAGRAGRALSVQKAADRLRQAGRVTPEGRLLREDVEALQRIAQRGYHEASDEMLGLMDVGGGIRLGAPFTRSASTQGILPGLTKQTSRARAGLRDVADNIGLKRRQDQFVSKTAPKEVKDAYTRLFRGEGPLDTEVAIEMVAADMARRRGQGHLAGKFGRQVDDIVRQSRKLSPEQKADVIRQLEDPDITPTGFAKRVRDLLDNLWEEAREAGVDLERRENYSPHILTREAVQWLRGDATGNLDVQRLRGFVTEDLFAPSGVTMHRKFRPGETIQLGKDTIRLDNASIDELNRAFRQATGKTFNLYETDPGDILEKYVNMLSSDVGTAFMARERGPLGGLMTAIPTMEDGTPVVGTVGGKGGTEVASNVGPQRLRPPHTPGQNASRISEGLPAGTEGPVMYGQSDLDVIGQRVGTDLDPNVFDVTRDIEATQALNLDITGSLRQEADRIATAQDEGLRALEQAIDSLPASPTERASQWQKIVSDLSATRKRLLSERNRIVRTYDDAMKKLNTERGAKVADLDRRAAMADELEQSIANIEDGVRVYNETLEAIMRDVEVMDQFADRAATRRLNQQAVALRAERDELQNALRDLTEREIRRGPFRPDPELVARQQTLTDDVQAARQDIEGLERHHRTEAGVPEAEAALGQERAALGTAKTNKNPKSIASREGRVNAAKRRLDEAERRAKQAMEADPAYRAAQRRLTEAQRRSSGPSVEAQARVLNQTRDPAAARTPNVAPPVTAREAGSTVGPGEALSSVGDFSDRKIREALGIKPGQQNPIPGSPQSREVAEETRKLVAQSTDPGEATSVGRRLTAEREDYASLTRSRQAEANEILGRLNEVNEQLTTLVGNQEVLDNLRELFRRSFMANEQGAARQQAEDAFDGLLSDYMRRQAGPAAQEQITELQRRIARLRQDVNSIAETVTPVTGSEEALIAMQRAQAPNTGRAMLNLPGEGRNIQRTQGFRTLQEIDDEIASQRQAVLDAIGGAGEQLQDAERTLDVAKSQLSGARAAQRTAYDAQRRGQQILSEIRDPGLRGEAAKYQQELEALATQAEELGDATTANLLRRAIEQVADLEKNKLSQAKVDALIADGKNGKLARVVNIELADNWSILESGVVGDKYLIHQDLKKAFQYVREAQYDKDFWPVVDGFTNFFKTYATLTPGFHVRNAISASFINASDGVPTREQLRSQKLMNAFLRNSKHDEQVAWLADPRYGGQVLNQETGATVADAFSAAFGSGIGGRYRERGFADRATARGAFTEWLYNNRATRLSKRAGGWVEGGVRLPVAMDTLRNGGSLNDAMERINRLHFDYSRVSELDERMRRLVPFWTFISRNLPLQITQMWQKPRLYNWYEAAVRNFSGEEEPGTPGYFDAIGAFRFADVEMGGLPLYLQPDLAHTRIEEDFERYAAALSGQPGQFLTDFNPMFTAPVEWATGKDFFTGREYRDTDLRKTGGLEAPIGMLADLLGQGEDTPSGDFATQERFISLARSLLPIYDRSLRVAPGITAGGQAAEQNNRQAESILRLLGAPVRQLSPEQQQATLRGDQFDERDRLAMQRALAALDR